MTEPPAQAIERTIRAIKRDVASSIPSVSQVAHESPDPFRILISTMISLRTKDEVTLTATRRLFAAAPDPSAVASLPEEEISRLIYPCGFYRTKAANIRTVAGAIVERGGRVPSSREELMALPGVGRKTANLTLGLGFGEPCICVDTHVHRIANRLGWVKTGKPEATEEELMTRLPRRWWIEINGILVSFGQRMCTPTGPRCSTCPVAGECPRIGVTRSR